MFAFIGWLLLLVFLGVLVVLLIAAGILNFILPSVILRASCSVSDVKEPRYLISFPLGYAAIAIYGLLSVLFVYLLGRLDLDPDALFGSMHVCGCLVGLAIGFVLVSLAYRLILAPSFLKGFRVAGLQFLLYGLASALEVGVLLAALSVWQLLGFPLQGSGARPRSPPPRRPFPPSSPWIDHDPGRRRHHHLAGWFPARRADGAASPRRPLRRHHSLRPAALPHGADWRISWLTARACCTSPTTCCCWSVPPSAHSTRRRRCDRPNASAAGCCRTPAAGTNFAWSPATTGVSAIQLEAEVVCRGRGRDFFGLNRALFAVVEAAILATRTAFLSLDEIRAEFGKLAVLVEKTGGPREREAFEFLKQYLTKVANRSPSEPRP